METLGSSLALRYILETGRVSLGLLGLTLLLQSFWLKKYIYIALKHVIWRFRICNYIREIFKFCDFMNTSRNFAKSVFARIFEKFKNLAKQFILAESPDHVF